MVLVATCVEGAEGRLEINRRYGLSFLPERSEQLNNGCCALNGLVDH